MRKRSPILLKLLNFPELVSVLSQHYSEGLQSSGFQQDLGLHRVQDQEDAWLR